MTPAQVIETARQLHQHYFRHFRSIESCPIHSPERLRWMLDRMIANPRRADNERDLGFIQGIIAANGWDN